MYRKTFSKASQEWLGSDADQNDSFSDSSYLFPIQCILQNEVMIARTELVQSSILGNSMKDICYWWDPIRESFLEGILLYLMMQSLIVWLNGLPWHLLSTIAQPWTAPVSVLGQSWPTFSLFFTSSVFPFHFAISRTFYFAQCPKHQGECQ